MPKPSALNEIQVAWLEFAYSVDRYLDPPIYPRLPEYAEFREEALKSVTCEQFLTQLKSAWPPESKSRNYAFVDLGRVLLLELRAFAHETEAARRQKTEQPKRDFWKKPLGRASIITGSVGDVLQTLPPFAKAALTLFKELIDLFKGSD